MTNVVPRHTPVVLRRVPAPRLIWHTEMGPSAGCNVNPRGAVLMTLVSRVRIEPTTRGLSGSAQSLRKTVGDHRESGGSHGRAAGGGAQTGFDNRARLESRRWRSGSRSACAADVVVAFDRRHVEPAASPSGLEILTPAGCSAMTGGGPVMKKSNFALRLQPSLMEEPKRVAKAEV